MIGLLILLLAGCPATVRFPPDLWGEEVWLDTWDTAASDDPEEATIDVGTLEWGCDGDAFWSLALRTAGVAGGGALELYGTGDRAETHPLRLVATDPEALWDDYRVGPLASAVAPESQVAGSSTTLDCTADADTHTAAVRIEDRFGVLTDCVAWGDDPDALQALLEDPAVVALGGCRWVSP